MARISLARNARAVTITVVAIAALSVSVFGIGELLGVLRAPPAIGATASVDGLTATVPEATWIHMDHDMAKDAPGYQMPPAMMPGMPEEGQERLGVKVTVSNTSDETRPLRPGKEFILRVGADSRRFSPHSDTFGELPRLAPRNSISGVLFFDLPTELTSSSVWLEWEHEGSNAGLEVPLDGAPESHSSHNP